MEVDLHCGDYWVIIFCSPDSNGTSKTQDFHIICYVYCCSCKHLLDIHRDGATLAFIESHFSIQYSISLGQFLVSTYSKISFSLAPNHGQSCLSVVWCQADSVQWLYQSFSPRKTQQNPPKNSCLLLPETWFMRTVRLNQTGKLL